MTRLDKNALAMVYKTMQMDKKKKREQSMEFQWPTSINKPNFKSSNYHGIIWYYFLKKY